jgi:hypothetical protein
MGTLLIILCVVFIGIMLYSKYTENNSNATSANAKGSNSGKNGSQIRVTDNMLVIEHPITGLRLQVAKQDFSQEMTWTEAKKACNDLGNGWRLPTKEELEAMYTQLHKKGLGSFGHNYYYWSSTENGNNKAWFQDFDDGVQTNADKLNSNALCVRAVRAL